MQASCSGKMGPLLFGLLAAYIAEVAGLRSVPVELSSQDRDALFKGLNDIRASLGSSNMECLTKWSTELEAEAQKVASECTAKEEEGAHGVAVIYQTPPSPPTPAPPPAPTAPAAPAISTYLDVIKSYKTTLKPDCTCVATKEANCGTFKQLSEARTFPSAIDKRLFVLERSRFSLWNAGQVGCAVSKCSTPTQTSYVMACVFDKWAKRDKCSFSAGTECSFCLEGKSCVDKLCCAKAQGGEGSCGSSPAQLVPLYRMYNDAKKSMVLTGNSWRKTQLQTAGYKDLGVLGYISSQQDKSCAALKPLHEFSLQNDLDSVYLTDKLSIEAYGQRGYFYRGTAGYVVDAEGFCSSSVSAYNFLVSDIRNFYTAGQQEAETIAARKGNYSSFWYQGIPFALWTKP
ncbi:hypothetical protein M514_27025 [Trichuris suis]|uniref:Uncharacterized protein n=1 Tax=Trichuris suis TaxID=68888 RepID=A0A085MUA9_9BILA|nr:hypothetical protein M514_27025 [Trichuris suis]